MEETTCAEAFVEALHDLLSEDPRVFMIGGSLLGLGPSRVLMERVREDFPERTLFPPTSEAAVAGVGIGAAMAGMRPIVNIATASFAFQAWGQILNEAANAHYMTGGQTTVPVIFHMLHGIRGGGAAQHSHSPQAMFWNCPGLKIALPASPRDAAGLLRTAVKGENPVIFINHAQLLELKGPAPEKGLEIPFGEAEIKRSGKDVTVVATSLMVHHALRAAESLAAEGIDVEVVDPRTLVPLDKKTILASVAKTGRLVVADECHLSCGVAAEIAAIVADEGYGALKAPIRRVAALDVPVPFSPSLEEQIKPSPEKIAETVRGLLV